MTLDLNGFAVIGAAGALRGIVVSGSRTNVAVRNGTVKGWPSDGVDLSAATNTVVTDVLSHGNSGIGISAGDSSVVSGCVSRNNSGDNIRTGTHSVVTRCSAISSASGNGINAGGYGVISQCAANSNNQNGIRAFQRMRVSDCTTTNNTQSGIHITFVGTVERSFCNQNGNCGILMDSGGFVDILNNNCSEQSGAGNAGIRVTGAGACRIEGNNVLTSGTGIDVLSSRNVIFRNTAAGNGTDFNIVAGNTHGPVINAIGAGDVSAIAGPANHPTANFRY